MTKKHIIIAAVILLSSLILFILVNPPLTAPGISYYKEDENKRVIEIQNIGYSKVRIKEVLVDGMKPQKIELGVSRSAHIVQKPLKKCFQCPDSVKQWLRTLRA